MVEGWLGHLMARRAQAVSVALPLLQLTPTLLRAASLLYPSMSTRSKKKSAGNPSATEASSQAPALPNPNPSVAEGTSADGVAPDQPAASPAPDSTVTGVVCTPAPGDAGPPPVLDDTQASPEVLLSIVQPSAEGSAVEGETYVTLRWL